MGVVLVLGGFGLCLVVLVVRARMYDNKEPELNWKYYYTFLTLCIVATFIAFLGFNILASGPAGPEADYSSVLTILSMLAAGTVAGFFVFSHGEKGHRERFFPNAIAICFMGLFYLLFAGVAFYIGKSASVHAAERASVLVPFIMWVILVVNTLFDFWDYRWESARREKEEGEQ